MKYTSSEIALITLAVVGVLTLAFGFYSVKESAKKDAAEIDKIHYEKDCKVLKANIIGPFSVRLENCNGVYLIYKP